ncbi:hypothetical protein M2451_003869 [Dysgonomonas sp. PFB1-18]|uniref:hypothetical protein n=1 Tax=unclassified Dysgonomonas TaxID=2630389 RepID=UPI002473F3EA|nr:MULTISPECIES: hypothetical protein [unclassified Dysgonomonas]MDH6341092.1 hypothetical protein [Dysgonomonas sp. PF1-16]MDH6382528.1 hypothetical protein [Dysgonomonas sp. PFB1-18]MDH6399938.1 hypothetical protein [Dysgonomonas sp. PF1-23]
MDKNSIENSNSVSLIYAFKVALDKENYLLCRDIKNELIERKQTGELINELIIATERAYETQAKDFKDMQYDVFAEMLQEIKNI